MKLNRKLNDGNILLQVWLLLIISLVITATFVSLSSVSPKEKLNWRKHIRVDIHAYNLLGILLNQGQ